MYLADDKCEHGTALPLCTEGCIQKLAAAAENNIVAIRHALNERHALRSNLQATQERCNQLLEENRKLKVELAEQLSIINHLLQMMAETPLPTPET